MGVMSKPLWSRLTAPLEIKVSPFRFCVICLAFSSLPLEVSCS